MRDTVVSIRGGGNNDMVFFLESDSEHPEAQDYRPLGLKVEEMPTLDTEINVAAYGSRVHAALSGHPAVGYELTSIFGNGAPTRQALRFVMRTPDAEKFRWEAIYGGQGPWFLSIRDLSTVSRIAPSKPGATLRAFGYPLQMYAFLSAAGIKAADEMAAIRDHIVTSRAAGLKIECTAYLAEQELLDQYRAETATGGPLQDKGIIIKQMPTTAVEITNLLKDGAVQFVHFFCHGVERIGVQGLSLATTSDHEVNQGAGNANASSIFLATDALSAALALNPTVWVTVFNSCSGAEVLHQLFSMALEVAKKGCPYTVGMAEPIDTGAATTFTQEFYDALFDILKTSLVIAGEPGPVTLDLAPAVIPARRVIHEHCRNMPGGFGRWLLPLLYEAGQQPFVALELPDNIAGRVLDVAKSLRTMQQQGAPAEVRNRVLALLDKDPTVPASFKPDSSGMFKTR
jgi:hypothetical protein